MIERRYRERKLFEATIGSLEELVGDLIEPELRRLDEVLTDEILLETVVGRLAERHRQSRTRGRPGTPAEVVLRLLVLKRLKGWTFDETEREVRKSLVYRYVTRLYFERVPDAKTLIRLSGVVGSEGVEQLHRRIVDIAREKRVVGGRRARLDTTVVETNIRYPTDSRLLADGVRVLTRNLKRIEDATARVGRRVRDRMRSATRRVVEIARAARGRIKMRESSRERMQRSYERLLEIVRATVRDAKRMISEIAEGVRAPLNHEVLITFEAARAQVEHFLPLVARVIAQTRARVFGGNTHYRDKVLSLFEPHTEAIRKGKASKPTEFGKLVKIQEAENQIVVDYEVYDKRPEDQALLLPGIAAHEKIFGKPPELLAADRGFSSRENKRRAKEAGVRKVCIAAQGRLSEEDRAEERQRWFRRAKRYRTGCEGRISVLKRRDGLGRCRYRGMEGMKRWTGWAVVSNNLWVLMSGAGK